MNAAIVTELLGGLALFLYGMQMMSSNLEATAGSRMKDILEKLTANRVLGVMVGAGITAVIQSSSATTVMVVGFVNAGLMNLRQAVWIIMGANIGTTITGQLIALDIGAAAPLFAFIGVFLVIFFKCKKVQCAGGIVAGLGVLFIGMGMMGDAMAPLQDSPGFVQLMTRFSNPFFGIMAGAVFTAVIQSSSASVGILQALAVSGLIGLDGAVYVLFGQNIGTCITAVLASVGTHRNAKRATVIHLLFNIIGTLIFVSVCMITPFVGWMEGFTDNPAAQIANVHTVFNITTTLLLLPFGMRLADLATRILPDKREEHEDEDRWFNEMVASKHPLGVSTMALNSLREEMLLMMELAVVNVAESFEAIEKSDVSRLEEIERREEEIDLWNVRLSRRVSKVLTVEQTLTDIRAVNQIFKIAGNIERIGDHAMNLAEYALQMKEKNLSFSGEALEELRHMKEMSQRALDEVRSADDKNRDQILGRIEVLEEQIDETTDKYRANQMDRIRVGECNIETSILYSEILTDYERIGDHILNIAESYMEAETGGMKVG